LFVVRDVVFGDVICSCWCWGM